MFPATLQLIIHLLQEVTSRLVKRGSKGCQMKHSEVQNDEEFCDACEVNFTTCGKDGKKVGVRGCEELRGGVVGRKKRLVSLWKWCGGRESFPNNLDKLSDFGD